MKKIYLFFSALIVVTFVVSGCGPKKVSVGPFVDSSVTQDISPVDTSTAEVASQSQSATSSDEVDNPLDCESDRVCFLNQLQKCRVAEFKVVSPDGEFQSSIIGLVGDRCYYTVGQYKDGVLVGSSLDCRLPLNLITNDVVDHLLGQDKIVGKEDIKAEQDKIQTEYCLQN